MARKKRISKILTRQRDSGKWCYRFEVGKVDGARKWTTAGGYETEQEAYEAGVIAYNQYTTTGLSFVPTELSVADFLTYWMDEFARVNLAESTVLNYSKKIKNHITPAIGTYKLRMIQPAVLQRLINEKFNSGYSRNSVATIKGILTSSFRFAVKQNFIKENPMLGVDMPMMTAKPKKAPRNKERTPIPPDAIAKLFERFPAGHPSYIPLLLGYSCGMRIGEVFGLSFDDIDFDKHLLTVQRQVQYDSKGRMYFKLPKYNSVRTIDIDDQVFNVLQRALEKRKKSIAYYDEFYTYNYISSEDDGAILNQEGNGNQINLVCVRDDGTFVQPRTMQHVCSVMHHDFGFPDFDFHSLRHTHATRLAESGADIKYVQTRLGHKNVETTLQIYAHLTDKMRQTNNVILNQIAL